MKRKRKLNEVDYCYICKERVGVNWKGGTIVFGSKVGNKTICDECLEKECWENVENNFESLKER